MFSDKFSEVVDGLKNFGQTIFGWVWVLAFLSVGWEFYCYFCLRFLQLCILPLFPLKMKKENVKNEWE